MVIGLIEIEVVTGYGPGASPLDWQAYLLGAVLALPIVLRRKWPLGVLIACSVLLFFYYTFDRRNISPAPLLVLPTYDAALAGFMVAAIAIPAAYMLVGLFVVDLTTHLGVVALASDVPAQHRGAGHRDRARRAGAQQAGAGRGDGGPAAAGRRGTRGRGGPPGGRGAAAHRPGAA